MKMNEPKMKGEATYPCFKAVRKIERTILGNGRVAEAIHLMEMNADERKNTRKLLQLRKDLLNRCCPPTSENKTQFWEVTKALQRLSQLNKERTCELAGRLLAIPTYDFESDWCIVSCIEIDVRKPLSVLDDDDCYGSDFYRMGSLLAESDRYLKDHFDPFKFGVNRRVYWRRQCRKQSTLKGWDRFERSSNTNNWLQCGSGCECKWLRDKSLKIPYVVYELLDMGYFSVPDYLRLMPRLNTLIRCFVQHYVDEYGDKIIEDNVDQ